MKTQDDGQFTSRRIFRSRRRDRCILSLRPPKLLIKWFCLLTLCLLYSVAAGQTGREDETTRRLWDTAFSRPKRRPAATAARRNYRLATPRISPANIYGDTVIGVTVWRLRPSHSEDAGERILEHQGAGNVAWIPRRVPSNAALSEGDRVRLSIEAARAGYLYVIDREQYADGTLGEPYLIFPTTRTLGGDNQVKAGRLVDVPAQEDSPPYFTLRRSRTDQVGELLSVIVTKAPLDELQIGDKAQKLSVEQLATWEKSWGGHVGRLELSESADRAWTKEEREAGARTGRPLKADAPAPQTLYYSPGVKADGPLLVKVQLQYAQARPRARRAPVNRRRSI